MLRISDLNTVPWITMMQWFHVREKLTSERIEDAMDAYETLSSWKKKTDNLPAFVECTYGLLKVMAQDYLLKKGGVRDYDIRSAYSTEIIRFVNHVHSVTKVKLCTLYSAAKVNHVPEWIVTLRHEAAHGQTLPAVETFHLAAKVCMTWLLKNYWFFKEKFTIKLEQSCKLYAEEFLAHNVNVRLYSLYKKTLRLWETCCEISNDCLISDLPNENLYYISNLVRLYKTHEYTSKGGEYCEMILRKLNTYCVNSNEHRLKDLKRSVIELMKYLTSHEKPKNTFIYTLLQADFMFDFMHVEWKEVIYFVQIVKCFDLFVKALFDQVRDDNLVALDVLDALVPSIENLKHQWPKYKEKFKDKSLDKKCKMKLKKKYCKSYKHLKFPLKLQKPPPITLETMIDLFRSPTKPTRNLICKYLPLINPAIPKNIINEITELLDIYCGLDKALDVEFPPSCDANKIYTLDDIKMHFTYTDDFIYDEKVYPNDTCGMWIKNIDCENNWSGASVGTLPKEFEPKLLCPTPLKCHSVVTSDILLHPPLTVPESELFEFLDFEMLFD